MRQEGCHPDPEHFAKRRASGEGARQSRRAERLVARCGFGPLAALRVTTVLLAFLTACASPEAHRTRGDGPGADVRNWGKPVELHAGAQPYHKTPCVTEPVECNGPPPVFGPTPPPD
jgi:hypothetical protein